MPWEAKCPGTSRAPQALELAMEPQMVGPGVGAPGARSNGMVAVLQQKRLLMRIPEEWLVSDTDTDPRTAGVAPHGTQRSSLEGGREGGVCSQESPWR